MVSKDLRFRRISDEGTPPKLGGFQLQEQAGRFMPFHACSNVPGLRSKVSWAHCWAGMERASSLGTLTSLFFSGVARVDSVEKEARRALVRLRRAVEKSQRELEGLVGAIRLAEGEDFPAEGYSGVEGRLQAVADFLEEEGRRLEAKLLETGGLEPGRTRRSSMGE